MSTRFEKLAAADVLRVLCVFLIAWYHIWQLSWLNPGFSIGSVYIDLQQVIRNGYMLVDTLLLLSGFLLFLPYARFMHAHGPWPDTATFYKKRVLRIVPAYYFAVFLILFAYDLPHGVYADAGAMWRDLLTHLTFTHNLTRETYFFTNLDGVLWTMAVEAQFYFIFPLLARAFVKKPLLTWLSMTLLAFGARHYTLGLEDTSFLLNQLPCLLDVYALGMLAAFIFAKLETKSLPKSLRWFFAPAALLCLACLFQLLYKQPIGDPVVARQAFLQRRFPLAALGAGFLLCGGLAPASLSRIFGNPITVFLAGVSYNYYIWHQYLARLLVEWNIPAHVSATPNFDYEQPWQSLYTPLCFIAALAAAVLTTYLVEKPAARLGTRLLLKKKTGRHSA